MAHPSFPTPYYQPSPIANHHRSESRRQRRRWNSHRYAGFFSIGARPRLDSFHPTTEIAFHPTTTEIALMITAGIFPAGLVFRAFILNTLIRCRVISADTIVSNGTARPRALWRLNRVHVCSRYHRGFEFGPVRDSFPSHLPCNHPARWLSQKFFRALPVAAFLCCVLHAIVLRYSAYLPRRLMLLPAMIVLGGKILGWEAVDMETVMHVRAPRLPRCVIWPLQRSDNRASFLTLHQCLMLPIACRDTRRRVLAIS